MCGIAGYIGSRQIGETQIRKCLDLMARRGPDAEGWYEHSFSPDNRVLLLHTRLAIIDLDKRADQPFRHGSKVMIYNGELYNYKELKPALEKTGPAFKTESDTEVLLRQISDLGISGLDACEGMWALAVYDEDDGTLLISRDRFGEKPLFIYEDQTGLYFASQAIFIFALLGRRLPVNMNHLLRYLVNGYRSLYKTGDTFFTGLKELKAGRCLTVGPEGKSDSERYWTPRRSIIGEMTYEDAVAGARDRLIRTVETRLRSDAPLAFCMSGGIDSNTLISTAKRVFDYDVHGFTIVNKDKRYDEQDLVDSAVKELGVRHTSILTEPSGFLEGLEELVRYHAAPVYTITYYAHWLLMRSIAGQGYKIALSGTGADELFSGYYDHHLMYLREVRHIPEVYETALSNWKRYLAPEIRNPLLRNPDLFIDNKNERDHLYSDAGVFASFIRGGFVESFTEDNYDDDLLRNRMLNELFHESVPVILHDDDLNSMFYSVENRSPFLDRNLFEFCYNIPTRHLIGQGYNKKILRDAMKGIVPDAILAERRKVGFNAPISSFLDFDNAELKSYLLQDSPVFELVRKEPIEKLFSNRARAENESRFLFGFICARFFLEAFL